MPATNEFYLDGNVIVELDRDEERFRFWPKEGHVRADAREFNLLDIEPGYWHEDATEDDLEDIAESATELDQEMSNGTRRLVRADQ